MLAPSSIRVSSSACMAAASGRFRPVSGWPVEQVGQVAAERYEAKARMSACRAIAEQCAAEKPRKRAAILARCPLRFYRQAKAEAPISDDRFQAARDGSVAHRGAGGAGPGRHHRRQLRPGLPHDPRLPRPRRWSAAWASPATWRARSPPPSRPPARRPSSCIPAEASHGDLGMITSDDVFIALSNSGQTEELPPSCRWSSARARA